MGSQGPRKQRFRGPLACVLKLIQRFWALDSNPIQIRFTPARFDEKTDVIQTNVNRFKRQTIDLGFRFICDSDVHAYRFRPRFRRPKQQRRAPQDTSTICMSSMHVARCNALAHHRSRYQCSCEGRRRNAAAVNGDKEHTTFRPRAGCTKWCKGGPQAQERGRERESAKHSKAPAHGVTLCLHPTLQHRSPLEGLNRI